MSTSLQRVVWSEGMLMAPQHFQHQDRYHEALLDTRLGWTVPEAVGVVTLAFDEAALAAGMVALTCFHGVLPGGAPVRVQGGADALPRPRSLGDAPRDDDVLAIYVGVARERPAGGTFARPGDEHKRARYLTHAHLASDAVSSADDASIELGRCNVVILLGEEADDGYDAIKIAEVGRAPGGGRKLIHDYIPPCLRLRASPRLAEVVRQVRTACVARRTALAASLRQRDAAHEFAADEVTRYLALHAVGGVLPLLTQHLEGEDVSPREVYATLLGFAGQLSAFDGEDDPVTVPSYRSDDLRGTFDALAARILRLLDVAVASKVITVALDARVDGMHLARLSEAFELTPATRCFLAVQAELGEAGVYELVPRVSKVASWAEIARYLEGAASAVPLTACLRPPRALPLRAGKYYFEVEETCAAWQAVVRERALAVHLPPPFEPRTTSVELLIIQEG